MIDPSAETGFVKRSGMLALFVVGTEAAQPTEPAPAYARFKVTRSFIDDLNRMLPIRLRIQLEGEISGGRVEGEIATPQIRFVWKFAAERLPVTASAHSQLDDVESGKI